LKVLTLVYLLPKLLSCLEKAGRGNMTNSKWISPNNWCVSG
jgi:hypothetical protein